MDNDKKDFESGLLRLSEIVEILEGGDVSLDESIELFKEGIDLSHFCKEKLKDAEKEVTLLLKDNEGNIYEKSFNAEGE